MSSSSSIRSSAARVRRFLRQYPDPAAASPVASTSQSAAAPLARVNPIELRKLSSPFAPFKNPESGRWWPARYSARREASLAKAALAQDPHGVYLANLPPGKKVDKLLERLHFNSSLAEGADEEVLRLLTSRRMAKMEPKHQEEAAERLLAAQRGPWPLPRLGEEETRTELMRVARSTLSKQGPYAGRKPARMFKGTKAELSRPSKDRKIAEKLEAMQDVVKEWKQTKLNERSKARPAVPF